MNDYRKLELQRKANHKKEEYKYFIGTTEKNPLEYRVGERIVFKIRAKHEDAFLSVPYLRFFLTCDDGQVYDGFAKPAEDGWFYIETTLKKSGFAYLKAKACDEEKRPIGEIDEFNGSACANAEEILRASKIPEDYAAFRESLCKAVEDCETRVLYSQRIESERFPDFETYNMRIAAPGSEYVSVSVSYPKGAQNGSLALAMFFQGYGVCSADPIPRAGYLSVHVNAHCIRNGESHEYYDALREGALKGYGFHAEENKSTSTSYWTKMILRDLQALHFFREHPLLNQRDYFFLGSSQGGMQACNVAALFDRATAVIMNVPGFADIYGDVAEGKRKSSMPKGDGIGYFDTALAAEFLKCPAFIISGLGDSTCFPSTQLALFNAIHTPKYIEFYQNKTHSFTIPWDNCVYTMGDAALAERHMDLRAMYYDWN